MPLTPEVAEQIKDIIYDEFAVDVPETNDAYQRACKRIDHLVSIPISGSPNVTTPNVAPTRRRDPGHD